jgi:hypothetical protein
MTGPRAAALAAVLSLPALAAAQMAPAPSPVAPSPSPVPTSSAAPSPAPSATASPSPGPLANTLKWSTASEVENFGYDVYRADKEDGPWVRINAKPIPGAGTLDEPSYYQYVDTDIDPTRGYFYYVESISLKGVREKFTPVIKAKPKRPLPGASPSEASPAPPASPAAPPSPSSKAPSPAATTHPPVLASPSPP